MPKSKNKKKAIPEHHWNYRVISKKYKIPNFTPFSEHEEAPEVTEETFGIHEVYYKNGVPVSCTQEPVALFGNTEKELKKNLKNMLMAFDKPSLDYSYFEELEILKSLDDE